MRRFLVWSLGLLAALVVAVLLLLIFPPTGFIANKIEEIVAARTGYALDIGELDLDLLSFTPSATVSSVSVDGGELPGLLDLGRAEVAVDLGAALGGEIVIDRVVAENAKVSLLRTADGRTSWTPGPFEPRAKDPDEPDAELALPTIRELRIEDLDVVVNDELTGNEAAVTVQASGSTLPGEPPLTVAVDGNANGAPLQARLELESPLDAAVAGGPVRVALDASTDGAKVALSGSIAEPATLGGLDLVLDADVESLDGLETALKRELPTLAPANLDATLKSEGDDIVLAANGTAAGEPLQASLALDLQGPILEAVKGDEPVGIDLAASVGGAKLGVTGSVGDPASLGDVDLALDANVGSLDALETVLGTELPALAPATLKASVRSEGDGYVVAADGTVDGEPVTALLNLDSSLDELAAGGPVNLDLDAGIGGAKFAVSGRVGDLATLGDADLALDADVDSLDAVETLLGRDLPPLDSATLSATVKSGADGEGFAVRADGEVDGEPVDASLDLDASIEELLAGEPVQLDLDATVGGAKIDAAGSVDDIRTLAGADLDVDVDIDSLAALEKLTGTELPDIAPASLSTTLRTEDGETVLEADGEVDGAPVNATLELGSSIEDVLAGGPVQLDLDASVGGAKLGVTGSVEDPRNLAGVDLALDADVESLDAVETLLGRDLPPLDPATLSATVKGGGDGEGYAVRADGEVDGEPVNASLDLDASVDELLAGEPVQLDLDATVGGAKVKASGSVGDIRTLEAADLDVDVDIDSLAALEKLSGIELPDIEPASLSTTLRTKDGDTVLEADGTVGGEPVSATATLESSIEGVLAGGPVTLDASASVGGAKVAVKGTIEDPKALKGVDLALDADVESLAAVETLLGTELPDVEPASLTGQVLTDGDEYVLRRFEAKAAKSTLQGDVRVDPTTGPPTVYANLVSKRLDVDALLEALGIESAEDVVEDDSKPKDGDIEGPVLSSDPLPIPALFGSAQGKVDLRVDELVYAAVPLESLKARADLTPGKATVTLDEVALAGGDVTGTLRLEPVDGEKSLDAKLDMKLSRVQVARFVPDIELLDDLGGPLGGQVEFWASGDSVAALAGSLDGGVSLLMGKGRLDSLLVELAGLDLFQSIGDLLNPGEQEFQLRCAYASLLADDGIVSLADFVIDSSDTVFLARGAVDLGAETLDIALEPHPKDPSLLAAATGVKVGGTFAEPAIEIGSSLPGRAALAAALAVVATPAAALLPFIGVGGADDSGFCDLEGALDGDAG